MEEVKHDHHHHHHHEELSKENVLKLLEYMLDHNKHHTEELEETAELVSEKAAEYIHQAVEAYEKGNEKLSEALNAMKEEQ